MKTIVVKTQAELDALPDSFTEYTVIEIRSEANTCIKVTKAYGSSRVEAYGSSRVAAYGSSRVEAHDSSRVEAYDFATTQMLSSLVVLILFNYSIASVRGFKPKTKIVRKHKTTTVVETPERIERSFKEWLKMGYVHADGITKKFLSKKKIGNIEVFEVEEFLDRKSSYVVKKDNIFSHGKTIKEAKDSLKYKISSRDTTPFKKWKMDTVVTQAKMIEAYRVITGACEYGVRQWAESKKLPTKLSVKKAIELVGDSYGHKQFTEFFGKV